MSRLFLLDLRASLAERKVWLALAMYAYALLGMPALLSRPPAHVQEAVAGWFGTEDPFALFLYLWTDVAMNKLLAILGVVLAGGLLVREKELGILPILWSKPISRERWFLVRAASALGVTAILYLGAHLVGLLWFSRTVPGFRAVPFLASMSLHLWAALFATALSATLGVLIGRRGPAALVSVLVLLVLVGSAFAGFYNPEWSRYVAWNPITLGVQVLGHTGDLRLSHVLEPMAALMGVVGVTLLLGARAARRVEV